MKPIIRLLFLSLLFNLFLSPAYGQIFEADKEDDGSHTFTIERPVLTEKTKAVSTTPFYKHTIIFGDGTFRFFDSDHEGEISHLYGVPPLTDILQYSARAYSAGAYSDEEDDVPDMKAPPIGVPVSGELPKTEVVDSGRYVKLLRYVEVKPGDSFIYVLSVRNPDTTTFAGQLFFFYNGLLNTVRKDKKTPLQDFSVFNITDKLFYRPDVGPQRTFVFDTVPASIQSKYEKMLLMEITSLGPEEEVQYYIEMDGDAGMLDLFESTVKAEMDFALALGSVSDNFQSRVPDSLEQELNTLKIGSYIASIGGEIGIQADTVTAYDMSLDSTVFTQSTYLQGGASNIVDYYRSTASLVKSHDPNYMRMESCKCQEAAELYQVFTTIHCENNGYGETNHVFMDMKLPDGIVAENVVATPITYHPYGSSADLISMEVIAEDSIRWRLENFGIEGTPIHGVGDPRTFAEVQFHMYSTIEPSLLDSVYTCIRFDSLTNDAVCTLPVAVSMVGDELTEGVLTCTVGECSDIPPPPFCLPWWVWLLIILLIILLIWWYLRNN